MKKFLIGLMALVLCFTLASCGNKTDEKDAVDTGSANVENAENNADAETVSTLENINKDNYASILKERFGIDAKDIEEDGFVLQDVRGTDNPYSFQITLTYSTKHEDTFKEQAAMKSKVFDVTKTIGGGFNYKSDEKGYITDKTFSDFESFKAAETYDTNQWYYKWNGNDYRIYCTAGSTLWIQITCSKK